MSKYKEQLIKSRFEKQYLWHCQYHLIWVLSTVFESGAVKEEVESTIKLYVSKLGCQIVELNVQIDHVHLLAKIPPKVSISTLMGTVKGKAAMRVFTKFPGLKVKANHFLWILYVHMIRRYVKYQENKEKRYVQKLDINQPSFLLLIG